jgi:hypothetical protein
MDEQKKMAKGLCPVNGMFAKSVSSSIVLFCDVSRCVGCVGLVLILSLPLSCLTIWSFLSSSLFVLLAVVCYPCCVLSFSCRFFVYLASFGFLGFLGLVSSRFVLSISGLFAFSYAIKHNKQGCSNYKCAAR